MNIKLLVGAPITRPKLINADAAYDTNAIREYNKHRGVKRRRRTPLQAVGHARRRRTKSQLASWSIPKLDTDALYPIHSKLWGIAFKNKMYKIAFKIKKLRRTHAASYGLLRLR